MHPVGSMVPTGLAFHEMPLQMQRRLYGLRRKTDGRHDAQPALEISWITSADRLSNSGVQMTAPPAARGCRWELRVSERENPVGKESSSAALRFEREALTTALTCRGGGEVALRHRSSRILAWHAARGQPHLALVHGFRVGVCWPPLGSNSRSVAVGAASQNGSFEPTSHPFSRGPCYVVTPLA